MRCDLASYKGCGTLNEIGFATEVFREELDRVPDCKSTRWTKLRRLALTEHGELNHSDMWSLWIYHRRSRPT